MSKADTEEMFAAAEAKGVMCQEGMWTRYFPAVEHARSLIDSGAIGQVRLVQADMGGLMLGGDKSEMLTKRGIANSMLSCYTVQSGPFGFPGAAPAKITAAGHMPKGYDVFTSAGASIEFDTNVRSICALTWTMEAPLSRKAVISGTHGRITLEVTKSQFVLVSVKFGSDAETLIGRTKFALRMSCRRVARRQRSSQW